MTIGDKPFNYPRLNGGFDEIRIVLDEIVTEGRKDIFSEEDCKIALKELVKHRRFRLDGSEGGKARDIIKLLRWLGFITSYDERRPVRSILTQDGVRFLRTEPGTDGYKELLRSSILSWKIYPHHWMMGRKEISAYKIRPGYLLAEIAYRLDQPIRSEEIFLTVMRAESENILELMSLIKQYKSNPDLVLPELSTIELTRMENTLGNIKRIVQRSGTFTAFLGNVQKAVKSKGKKPVWGYGTFRKGRSGFNEIEAFYRKKQSLKNALYHIRIDNAKQQAHRVVGPLMKLMCQADIIVPAGPGKYAISPTFKTVADGILKRPTIRFEDMNRIDPNGALTGYLLELFNSIRRRENRTVMIKKEELFEYVSKRSGLDEMTRYILDLDLSPENLDRILGFLMERSLIYDMGRNEIKIVESSDFRIWYDIPRDHLAHPVLERLESCISRIQSDYPSSEKVRHIHHLNFDAEACSSCLRKYKKTAKLPCVNGCRMDRGVPRMGFILARIKDKDEVRPSTCLGCRNCYIVTPARLVTGEKRTLAGCGACPAQGALTLNMSRIIPHHSRCLNCLLCGVYCPFAAVTFDRDGYPNICNPDECNRGCLQECRDRGYNGIIIRENEMDMGSIDLLKESISSKTLHFETDLTAIPDRFIEGISLTDDENLTLNPFIAYSMKYLTNSSRVISFKRVPGSGNEIDVYCESIEGTDHDILCELKSGKSAKDRVPGVFANQLARYVPRARSGTHNRIIGVCIKELSNEKDLEEDTWTRHCYAIFSQTREIKGVISPNAIWQNIYHSLIRRPRINLHALFTGDSFFVLDDNFKSKFGGQVIIEGPPDFRYGEAQMI